MSANHGDLRGPVVITGQRLPFLKGERELEPGAV